MLDLFERLENRLYLMEKHMAASSADVLAAVAADSAKVDALAARMPVATPPEDLQPVMDAVAALGEKIDAIAPAAAPAAPTA